MTRNPDAANSEAWPSKATGRRVEENDVIRVTGPNSGGYGPPHERAPAAVLADYLDGIIARETAQNVYKVVIDQRTRVVDEAATARLRKQAADDVTA